MVVDRQNKDVLIVTVLFWGGATISLPIVITTAMYTNIIVAHGSI